MVGKVLWICAGPVSNDLEALNWNWRWTRHALPREILASVSRLVAGILVAWSGNNLRALGFECNNWLVALTAALEKIKVRTVSWTG